MIGNRVVGLGILLLGGALAALSYSQSRSAGDANGLGRYLVEEVARCGECHTPRNGQGGWDESKWLQGAPIWFRPTKPVPNWGYWAPRLAGLPNFTDEQMRVILEQGIGPNGLPIRLPMHPYRLSAEDARAIIAYLRLPGPQPTSPGTQRTFVTAE